MSIDGWRPAVETATVRRLGLERDWKRTLIAGTVVALVSTLTNRIPW